MLQNIRDHTQGWIAGGIISLLILSFGLWGIHSYFVGGGGNNVVAKVNGAEITKSQLAIIFERMRHQAQTQLANSGMTPEQIESGLKKQALETLVSIQVLKQASIHDLYQVSTRQVDNYLENIPDFQVNGQFSLLRFKQILSATLFSVHDFLELIKTNLLIDQPRLGMIFTSFALPNETLNSFALINQERDISYAILPFSHFNTVVDPTNEQIQSYYNQHQEEFKTPEQVNLDYIQLSMQELASTINPTEEMLKAFYTENTGSYSTPMEWKLEAIMLPLSEQNNQASLDIAKNKMLKIYEIAKTTDLSKIPNRFSEVTLVDKQTLPSDWVNLNNIPIEWQKSVLNLKKIGQVSMPILTKKGMVIVKIVNFREAKVKPYNEVKAKLKETYIHQKAEEKFAELKEKLANIAYEHPESLTFVAKTLNLTVKKSESFSRDKGGKDVSADAKVREVAFSNEVLIQQNNSDIIQISPDIVLIIRVNSHTPVTLLPLKVVENQIKDRLKAIEIENKTAQIAQEVKQKLLTGSTLESIANAYQLKLEKVGFIGRHSNKVETAILNTAFQMPNPNNGSIEKSQYEVAKLQNGYAIIALLHVKNGLLNATENKDQYKVFAEQIQNTQGLLEYELYKYSHMQRAKIVLETP